MTDKLALAEEILFRYRLKSSGMTEKDMIEAIQAYHEAKKRESKITESFERENHYVTDEDIEKWANSKEKIIDEMPETLIDRIIIEKIIINKANLEYCAKNEVINGSLLQSIREAMQAYHEAKMKEVTDRI